MVLMWICWHLFGGCLFLGLLVSLIYQYIADYISNIPIYTDDNFRIIWQARSSFYLSVLESVYIKTQNPDLCKQKEFVFSLKLFKETMVNMWLLGNQRANSMHYSLYLAYPDLAIHFSSPLRCYPTFHTPLSVGREKHSA